MGAVKFVNVEACECLYYAHDAGDGMLSAQYHSVAVIPMDC